MILTISSDAKYLYSIFFSGSYGVRPFADTDPLIILLGDSISIVSS